MPPPAPDPCADFIAPRLSLGNRDVKDLAGARKLWSDRLAGIIPNQETRR